MNGMHERLKMIREHKKMNQAEFSKLLGIAQSTLAMMEVGKRAIQDRHVKMICSICNINENWFRTGDGTMLLHTSMDSLGQLAVEYNLTDVDQAILKTYMNLPKDHRYLLFQIARQIVNACSCDVEVSQKHDLHYAAEVVDKFL